MLHLQEVQNRIPTSTISPFLDDEHKSFNKKRVLFCLQYFWRSDLVFVLCAFWTLVPISLEIKLSNEGFCGIWGMEEREELSLFDFGSKILAIFRIKYKLSKEIFSGRWRMEEEEEWGLLDEPRARDVRRKVHWVQLRSRRKFLSLEDFFFSMLYWFQWTFSLTYKISFWCLKALLSGDNCSWQASGTTYND